LVNLETKLNQLIDWIQDPTIEPAKRFQLLQEIAEEAARYKLGGDDKIRVAGGACDGVSNIRPYLHPHPRLQYCSC
jgi:inhibitor of growth protein 3